MSWPERIDALTQEEAYKLRCSSDSAILQRSMVRHSPRDGRLLQELNALVRVFSEMTPDEAAAAPLPAALKHLGSSKERQAVLSYASHASISAGQLVARGEQQQSLANSLPIERGTATS